MLPLQWRVLFLATGRRIARQFALLSRSISWMSMHQMAGCISKALNERSDRYQQGREEEHCMCRDTQADCERDQQSCIRWFDECEEHFFHNATSFLQQT
jgi:hypothetical protein